MNTSPAPVRVHVALRWSPLVVALLFTIATLGYLFAIGANPVGGEDVVEDAKQVTLMFSLVGVSAFPVGLALGFAARVLVERFGLLGGVVFLIAVPIAALAWVGFGILLVQHPIDPEDVGWVTTDWLWDQAGWKGLVLYLFTVAIDAVIMMLVVMLDRVAMAVLPPLSFACVVFALVAAALPGLVTLRRRRARALSRATSSVP